MCSSGISSSVRLFSLLKDLLLTQIVAGLGMVISAQWELVIGNSFGYTALSAFGMDASIHLLPLSDNPQVSSMVVSEQSSRLSLESRQHTEMT